MSCKRVIVSHSWKIIMKENNDLCEKCLNLKNMITSDTSAVQINMKLADDIIIMISNDFQENTLAPSRLKSCVHQ